MPLLLVLALVLLGTPAFAQVYTNLDPATGRRDPATIVVVTGDTPRRAAPQVTPALLARQWVPPPPMGMGPTVSAAPYDPEWPFSQSVRLPERYYYDDPYFLNGLAVSRPPYLAPLGWTSVATGGYRERGSGAVREVRGGGRR